MIYESDRTGNVVVNVAADDEGFVSLGVSVSEKDEGFNYMGAGRLEPQAAREVAARLLRAAEEAETWDHVPTRS